MSTLVIHAPKQKSQLEGKRSFEDTFASRVGDGYAIAKKLFAQISIASLVVLLCKENKKRAEGRLIELTPNGKTDSGIQRYDVRMENLRMVPYKPERLNRNGVAVI